MKFLLHMGVTSADLLQRDYRQQPASSNPPAAASQPSQAKPSQAKPRQAKPSQVKPSQASQPTMHPSIEASGLQAWMYLLYRGIQSVLIRWHRPAQSGTGCHRPPQVGKRSGTHSTMGGSQACYKPFKYRRHGQLSSKLNHGVPIKIL